MLRASQLAMVILLASSAIAQIRAGGMGPGTLSRIAPHPFAIGHNHRHFYPGYGYYALPYFYSDYEPYEDYIPELPLPPRQQPIAEVKTEPAPDPVLLELHGSQWVKVNNFSALPTSAASAAVPAQGISSKPLPPAVLVFRDGHTEEVKSYSIIGQTIYTKADYWSTGKWTRAIQLAKLNIPATIEQNHARGLNFDLPSSPDEIMLRP